MIALMQRAPRGCCDAVSCLTAVLALGHCPVHLQGACSHGRRDEADARGHAGSG